MKKLIKTVIEVLLVLTNIFGFFFIIGFIDSYLNGSIKFLEFIGKESIVVAVFFANIFIRRFLETFGYTEFNEKDYFLKENDEDY